MKENKRINNKEIDLGRFTEIVGVIFLVVGLGLFLYMVAAGYHISVIAEMVITGNPLFYLILGFLMLFTGMVVSKYGWEVEDI